ncbi:MAG: OmpA family protein, partial [Bacteroidetes bacterium]|nr:OmpA family protein [Bacteroidota bacterium]
MNHKKIGTANCTDCHNPHGGNEKFNLRTLAAKGYKHPALAAQIAMESEINTLADSSVKLLETERESPSPDTTLKPSYGKTLALTFFFGQVHRNLPGDIHPAMELLLLDNNGIVLSTTTTDSSGNFSIGIPQTGGSCIFRLKDDTCDAIISITEKNPELKYVMIKDKTGKYEFNKLALQNTTLGFEQVTDSTGISFIEPGNTSPVIPRLSGQIFGNISEPVHPGTEIFALNESREIIGVTRIDGKGNFVFRKLPPYNNYLFILKDVKDVPVHNIGKIYVGNITDKEIVPIGKGKDGYFRYRYLPFQALALWVTDASMDTLGLTHLNKDGFYVFDLLPDDSNLTFILSGGKNTSAIDEMNVIVNGRMRKIKKGTDNLFRFVKLPQGITRLYFMNETGDTLQTAFMNNDGFFDFKNGLPYRDNYLFLLDADNAGIADEIQILYPDDKSRQRIITLVKTEGAFFRYRPLPGEESKLYRLDQNYDTLDIAFMNEEGYFVFHELPTVNNYFFLLETRDAGMFQTVPVQIISGNGAIKEIIAKKESGARYRYEFPEQANAVIADSLKEQFIAVNLDKVEKKIVDFAVRNVEFNLGQFVINLYSYKYIEQISRLLISNPQWHIQVSGHTDNIGNENFNLLLSEKRAETVKRALVKRGIQANRIITKYFGESKPVADNLTP